MFILRVRTFLTLLFYLLLGPVNGQDVVEEITADSVIIKNYLERAEQLQYTDSDSAFILARKVVEMADELNLHIQSALGLTQLAAISSIRGDYTEALYYDLSVLEKAKETEDQLLLSKALNNIGNDHLEVRNFDEAYENFIKALSIAEHLGDDVIVAITTFNLGKVLKELEQFENALLKLNESLGLSIKIDDKEGVVYAQTEIGHLYFLKSEFDNAEIHYRKAVEKVDSLNIPDIKAELLLKHGMNQLHLGNIADAKMYFEESLIIAKEIGNPEMQAKVLNGFATVHLGEHNYLEAEKVIAESILLSAKSTKKGIEAESYRILYLIELQKKNDKKALKYYKQYRELQEIMFNDEKNVQISNLQLQHDLDKKDFEISSLKNRETVRTEELQKQKMLRNVLVVLLAFSGILLFAVYRSGQRRRKINALLTKHKNEVENQKNELAELNKLKDKFFSILAHDLRSPIRSLSGVLKLLESNNLTKEETEHLIGAIGRKTEQTQRLLDNLLEWALIQMDKITVNRTEIKLKQMVDNNIRFLEETFDKHVHILNEMDEYIAYADKNMIDLVIRNLLSNAIKYSETEGSIKVAACKDENNITVSISDNGVGISDELKEQLLENSKLISNNGTANEKGTGLDLKISKEFVERNGGTIWLKSEVGKGSIFSFSLPVLQTKQELEKDNFR